MHSTSRTLIVALVASLFTVGAVGCAETMGEGGTKKSNSNNSSGDESVEKSREKFRENIENLETEFGGEGKQDFLGLEGPCDVLEPMYDDEDSVVSARMGWFLELTGHANILPRSWEGGGAIVADFYHHQMKIGYFRGEGFTLSGGVGASASAHVGLLFGFQDNVMEYAGHFVSGEISASLPGVKEFFEGYAGLFAKGVDVNGDGEFDPTGADRVLQPPKGIYGGYVGIEGGVNFDPLLGAVPVEPSVSRSKHMLHKGLTRHVYDALDGKLFKLLRIDASLVTPKGHPCPRGWPKKHKKTKCLIEFGTPGQSHVHRAIQTGGAVCAVTGGCSNPIAWSAAAQSIAVGAVRDAGESVEEYCKESGGLF